MPTITKHNIIVLGAAVIISAGIFIVSVERKKSNTEDSRKISYNVFNSPNGWGYEILEDKKVVIHQDFVPVLQANKGFSKEEYAEKAAQLVIIKMHQKDIPSLSENDLAQICPIDKLLYEQPTNQ